jgi:hypothetical protein
MSLPKELKAELIEYRKRTDIKPWLEDIDGVYELYAEDESIEYELRELSDRINEKLDELIEEL